MKLEKLTEREKVEELGYISYEAFLKTNQLFLDILTGLYDKGEKIGEDLYIEDTLGNLATLLMVIRGVYERNGIKFEEKDVFSCEELQKMFLENSKLEKTYQFGLNRPQIEEVVTNATSSILQGIETMLSAVPKYEPKYKSKELDRSIKEKLKEVKEYAKIGTKIGEILIAMEMERKGHLIKAEMEQLTKTEDLMRKIKNEKMDKVLRPIIGMHAEVYNLPFDENSNNFLGESGEKINWIMILAKMIAGIKDIIIESQAAERKEFLGATLDGQMYIHTDAESVNKDVKEYGLVSFLADSIRQDEDFKELTNQIKAPFPNLEEKLNSVGVGYELAKKVSKYLSVSLLNRGVTSFKNVKEEEIFKLLAKQIDTEDADSKDEYAIAMKILIEKLSGKKIPDFAFSYFKKEEAPQSDAISGWVLVTKKGKNGKNKVIYEDHRHRSLEELLETAKEQFTKKEYEIFVTDNTGVCFTFDSLMGYTLTSKFRSLIEMQNSFEEISKADELSSLIYKTAVIAHETTHASQINSRLMWRYLAMNAATVITEMVLKWHKKGKLDYEQPESINCLEKHTYRKEMIEYLEQIAAQALGLGETAENYRQKGIYDAIIEKGATLREDGTFSQEYFSQVELEKSKTADLLTRIKKAIEKNDTKALSKLKTKTRDYGEELSSMVETMAETFGILATEDFIKNYPEKLEEEEKKKYAEMIKSRIISQGTRGEEFTKITSKYKEPTEEMEKELNKKGLTYKRILTKYGDQKPIEEKLIQLGYNPLNPHQAYQNMQELETRIEEHNKTSEKKIELKDVYYPLNNGRAQLDIRYRKNIPMYMKVVEKYGPQKAHDIMLNAESLKELEKLAKY